MFLFWFSESAASAASLMQLWRLLATKSSLTTSRQPLPRNLFRAQGEREEGGGETQIENQIDIDDLPLPT